MDLVPKSRPRNGQTDAEKLACALKKAKYDRARKAVNNSLDRSIESLEKRKQKRDAAQKESFVIRQSAALQQKNKNIILTLVKSRQYIAQLERVNFSFKNQQMALAMKLASCERKLEEMQEEYDALQKKCENNEKILSPIHEHLLAALRAFDVRTSGSRTSEPAVTNSMDPQPMGVVHDSPNTRLSTCSDTPQPVEKSPTTEKVPTSSISQQFLQRSVMSQTTDKIVIPSINYGSCKTVPLSLEMPVLAEEDEGEENETMSYIDISVNHDSSKLETSDTVVPSIRDHDSPNMRSLKNDESMLFNNDEEDFESAESAKSPKLNKTIDRFAHSDNASETNLSPSADITSISPDTPEELPILQSVSMVTARKSRGRIIEALLDISDSEEMLNEKEDIDVESATSEKLSNHCLVSTETASSSSQEKVEVSTVEKSENVKQKKVRKSRKNADSSAKKRRNVLEELTEHSASKEASKKKKACPKSRKPRLKKKPLNESLDKSVYDFLGCSNDSFILDEDKRVELNPKKLGENTLKQFPLLGKENEEPTRRRRRATTVASYAEPSLGAKLRRGDKFFPVVSL